jgi:hypothetical protein
MLATGDPATLGGAGLVLGFVVLFSVSERVVKASDGDRAAAHEFQVLSAADVDFGQLEASPGNFLVPVRRPHFLAHLSSALHAAGDRDVVARLSVHTSTITTLFVPRSNIWNAN